MALHDYRGEALAIGDVVVIAAVRRSGRFAHPTFRETTVTKVGRKNIEIAGRASPIDPARVIKR